VIKDQARCKDDDEDRGNIERQWEAFQLEETIRNSVLESNRRLTQYANNHSNGIQTYNIGPRPVPFGRTAQDLSGAFEFEGISVGYDNGFSCMNTSKSL